MNNDSPITSIKGIGEKTNMLFHRIGIDTVKELLSYYPRTYDVYEKPVSFANLEVEKVQAVFGVVKKVPEVKQVHNLQIVNCTISEFGTFVQLTWFNMPFLKNSLKPGTGYIFRGRVLRKNGRLSIEQPEIFKPEDYEELLDAMQPIYGLTAGLSNKTITKALKKIVEELDTEQEYLPEQIRRRQELAEYNFAIRNIHFPVQKDSLLHARKRLVFDEFFLFILALRKLKETSEVLANKCPMQPVESVEHLIGKLPYELTGAQKKVWEEVKKDLAGPQTMSRLVQGDVGSGKTIIAVLALVMAAENGFQGALMVPTEVLAKQHFASITELFEKSEISIRPILLVGSMTPKEKRLAYEKIEIGQAQIIIGTHALIQEKVNYQNLGIVITDEQHRFGVKQREALSNKGKEPHILVMSATPIPRTLAIIVYGDLDISVIDELPADRLTIKNCVVNENYRPKAYSFMQKEIESGRQIYIVCPMVEENPELDLENVIEYAKKLQMHMEKTYHKSVVVAYLHGKMKAAEKNEIMERFTRNEIQILVSTTVIEVGVNVPNASVMMVENAERFGLAQLHQLRGRVGRGEHQSYCIFVSGSESPDTRKRLEILNKSNDGFFIAGEDLKLRGPGDLFGIRQSGILEFRIGDIFTDATVLQAASEEAADLLLDDPLLEKQENAALLMRLHEYMHQSFEQRRDLL